MTVWRTVRFGDLVDFHNRRRVPLSKAVRATRPGPYPYFGAQGIVDRIDDFIFDGEFLLVAEDGENLRSRRAPIARLVTGRFWVNNHAHIVKPKPGLVDENFLLHLLNNMPLAGRVTGAAQPKLTKANLADLEFECPPYELQLRIGAFLSAFDKLIEINERRIELLEDLTRSLYREWFVHFRFPGHEEVTLVKSTFGTVPEKWNTSTLGRVAKITMGQSPKSEFYNEVGAGLPFHQGVSDFGRLLPIHSKYCTIDMRMAEQFDVLCSVRAPVGRLNVAGERLGIGRGLSSIRRNDGSQAFLLLQLREALGDEDSIGGGTIYKAIGKAQLADLPVLEPDPRCIKRFEDIARPMLDLRMEFTSQNRALAATRDLLLPRLVTGKLDISDIDLGVLTPAETE